MPIADTVQLGENVRILHPALVNLYGCTVGNETKIGTFVEIQKGAVIGARCKISSHTFICEGVAIEDGVFIGHGVMFTNDRYPRATKADGRLQTEADWNVEPTRVKRGASIGSNATVISGLTIGEGARRRRRSGSDEGRRRPRDRSGRAGACNRGRARARVAASRVQYGRRRTCSFISGRWFANGVAQ